MTTAIETRSLTKQWGDFRAVDELDLQVPQGECYAFLGRNGSGKSTTARMLLDFIRPTGGSAACSAAMAATRPSGPASDTCREV